MSKRHAAELAGMSEGRWRQLEAGGFRRRGRWEPESAAAPTLARMARAVGVTEAELRACGREDAAAELAALPPLAVEPPHNGGQPTWQDFERLASEGQERMRALEEKLEEFMENRYRDEEGPRSEQTTKHRRRAV